MRPSRSRLMARRAATSPPLPVGPDAATVQAALLRIAEAASAARDLDAFYATIHGIVGELMAAENFYIALVDTERGRMNYPYYVDDVDDDRPDPAVWYPFGEGQARGITAYALRRKRAPPDRVPVLPGADRPRRGRAAGRREPQIDVGGCSARRRRPSARYRRRPELYGRRSLHEVRPVLGVRRSMRGPERPARRGEARSTETRERNAELAIINEIGYRARRAARL